MGQLRAELDFTSVDDVIRSGLHEYLDRLQVKMNAVDDSLRETSPCASAPALSQPQTSASGSMTQVQESGPGSTA